jgi:carbonic anhydrase
MSCPTATAPIDISMSKITGKCEYKCSYSFSYNNSSCVATNRGDYLSLSYDKSSSPPVLYNSTGYDVQEIRIYIPSLHSYNDSKTDGEMVIVHSSNTGANPLLVCIPIKSNNTSSISAMFFKTVIDTVADSAPSDGESTTVNIPKYNLSAIVPRKPFFSYSATEPYQPCSSSVEYIVFTPLEASLDMMPETLTTLQSIIQSNPYDIKTGPNLFFNEKGPGQGSAGNDIYIDCQPVGSSDETTEVITDTGGSTMSFSDWLNNPVVKLILGSLVFIIILYAVNKLLNLFKPIKGGSVMTEAINKTIQSVQSGGRNIFRNN